MKWCTFGRFKTFGRNGDAARIDELPADSSQVVEIHLPHGSRERPIFYCSNWTGGRRKKAKKDDKQLDSHLLIHRSDADEAESFTDLSKPRKVHDQVHWRPEQDVVYWVNLSRAQDYGLSVWQTQSHAIVTCQIVPKDGVERVVSEKGDKQLFTRQLTPRQAPNVTFRNSWVKSDSSTSHQHRETDVCQAVLKPNPAYSESGS